MRYKFAAAVGGILIAGGLLFASGALLDHSTALAVPGVNADALSDASASQTGGGASSEAVSGGAPDSAMQDAGLTELAPDAFARVEVNVAAVDIRICAGDGYRVAYRLPEEEVLEQAEVIDGTLYFSSRLPDESNSISSNGQLVITVPQDAAPEELLLNTVSGNIRLELPACDTVSAASVSGRVLVDSGCRVRSASAATVSGDVELAGEAAEQFSAETVSGRITVTAADPNVEAATIGKITLDGEDHALSCSRTGSGCSLDLTSVSGDIDIRTR